MTQSTIGSNIAQSAALINSACIEINNMLTLLQQELSDALENSKSDLSRYAYFGEWQSSERLTESNWVCSDTSESLPIFKHNKNKEATRYFCIQVSLIGDGADIPGIQTEPLVHVALIDAPIDFEYCYITPEETLSDEDAVLDRGQEGTLISWGESSSGFWYEQQWCYSVKLTSLNTLDDLRSKIIGPALELLTGEEYSNVAMRLKDLEGIINYSK